jgi:predicted anti-sigma-YlaC factor YlaD
MKTRHIALIGAVGGPLIGLPIVFAAPSLAGSCFFYPVAYSMTFLERVVFPNLEMGFFAVYAVFMPLLVVYFAVIGVLFALVSRLFLRKLSV